MGQAENTRLRSLGLVTDSEASWRTCFVHWVFFPPQTQCCELTPDSYKVTHSFSGPDKRQKKKESLEIYLKKAKSTFPKASSLTCTQDLNYTL